MNTLTVTLLSQETECGTECAVRFDVDGISLLDQLRSYEERFALREGHPSLAGSYSWLPATTHTRQSLQLAMSCHRAGAPTALLECACGVPGCWPMLATITYQDATVTWKSFCQPHRDRDSAGGYWDYSAFGPFVFDQTQYELEISKISP